MRTEILTFGRIPSSHPAESEQFCRVESIVLAALPENEPWVVFVRDFQFHHTAGNAIQNDVEWDGQIDLIAMTQHRMVVYELKAFTARIIYGTTNEKPWLVRRLAGTRPERRHAFFDQASKQRAFLLREFLERYRSHPAFNTNSHYVVDSRLVFKSGSDLCGFFYRHVMNTDREELEHEVLPKIENAEDRDFVIKVYSSPGHLKGELRRRKLSKSEYERFKLICRKGGIVPRTAKWFGVLTEDMIAEDFEHLGSDRFELTKEAALILAEDATRKNEPQGWPHAKTRFGMSCRPSHHGNASHTPGGMMRLRF